MSESGEFEATRRGEGEIVAQVSDGTVSKAVKVRVRVTSRDGPVLDAIGGAVGIIVLFVTAVSGIAAGAVVMRRRKKRLAATYPEYWEPHQWG